jgi:hypothetical protein
MRQSRWGEKIMKKLLSIIALMFLLLVTSAIAVSSSKISVKYVDAYNDGSGITGMASIKNTGSDSLHNLHATMMIPELGLIASAGSFRLSSGDSTVKQFLLDSEQAASGEYYVRVSVGNSKARRVVYRIITIE